MKIFYIIFLNCFFIFSSHSQIKCWRNSEGIKECGNKIPPEYSQKASTELNKSGVVINKLEAAKSIHVISEERRKTKELQKKIKADMTLLKTFSTKTDLILARESKTQQIDKEIQLIKSRIKVLLTNMESINSRISGSPAMVEKDLESLKIDLQRIDKQISESQNFVSTKEQEKRIIEAQFEKDIIRFEELMTQNK